MIIFKSKFAEDILSMLDYREALGYSRQSYEKKLLNFDCYCAENYPDAEILSKEIVIDWLEEQHSDLLGKSTAIRLLGKYIMAIGKESYILYDKYVSGPASSSAHIFTDDELAILFVAIDTIKNSKDEPFISEIAPVLYRLIYTCGLRPNEGRELKIENINLKTGEILITNTKQKKERLVVMSNDMVALCREYAKRREIFAKDDEFFFPSWSGGALKNHQINYYFKSCWKRANTTISTQGELPSVRVYDLRHRFASAVLNRWLDNKVSIGIKLPYLRAYMGHSSLSETAYYIHLLPENLVKSAGIDWDAFDEVVPEVIIWQE